MKALAVAAMKCFEHYRPGGMRVCAGSVILEPGLAEQDFEELARKGVWLAKAGFGAFENAVRLCADGPWAKQHGMITTVHTGGSSIPGSSGIWADHLIAMQPHVSFHVNGGPIAMPDRDFPRLVERDQDRAAGLHRGQFAHLPVDRRVAEGAGQFERLAGRDRHADRKRHHAAWACCTRSRILPASRRFPSNGRSLRRPATMPRSIV